MANTEDRHRPSPGSARRELADELARLAARPEVARALRLAQIQGLLGAREEPSPRSSAPDATPDAASVGAPITETGPRPISVWRPTGETGEIVFERPEPLPLGDHYAARRRFAARPAPGVRRLCFLGESVAAGYLLAPHLTPAGVLEEHLGRASAGTWEVIDLARTNETLPGLVQTLRAARQLEPEVVVLFAGNNFGLLETPELSPYAPSVRARQDFALALREGGLGGPVAEARRRLTRLVETALAEIAAIAAGAAARVVWVVPEVNLADWEGRQPVPWLAGDGSARWHAALRRGVAGLAAGEPATALEAAAAMVRLDGGLVPTAHRLEARARLAQDDEAAAAAACRREVGAQHYPLLCHLGAPQVGPWVQELLRRVSRRHGFAVVDLPEVLARHGGSVLPGRRYFFDYCHLTAEGIHVAMAATTAAVLAGGDGSGPGWERLARELPPPALARSALATACFGAAVHSAHRLLALDGSAPLLEAWCGAALDASPGIADTLLDFAQARCSPLPAVLTGAQQRNLSSPYRLGLQHGWRWPALDADVLAALGTALETRGIAARDKIREWAVAGRGPLDRAVDLVDPRWHWNPLERFLPDAMVFDDLDGRAVYRAPWPASSFCLITDGAGDLWLRLVLRLPAPGGGGTRPVVVEVDGVEVGRCAAGGRWGRWDLALPAAMMPRGVHRLTLRWPALASHGSQALALARRRWEEGLEADLHPIFGEVFSLRVGR